MANGDVIIYKAEERRKLGLIKSLLLLMKNSLRSKGLIYQLFKRDFLMSYKKSFLGTFWIVLTPIITTISWVFMNMVGVLNPGDTGVPYPVYVLISTSIFGLFLGFMTAAAGILESAKGFIMQVNYPHDALLVKQTVEYMVRFFLAFFLNLIVIALFGVSLRWELFLLPLFMIPFFLLGSGIGLVQGLLAMVSMDMKKGIDFLAGLLIFITPVLYSFDAVEGKNEVLLSIIRYNPLTYLVGGARDVIFFGRYDYWREYAWSTGAAFLIFLLGWRLFYLAERRIIERMI